MNNIICYICQIEKAMQSYDGKDLLSENGDKPCFECYLESEASKEENEDNEF